jgi:hypothetical protein
MGPNDGSHPLDRLRLDRPCGTVTVPDETVATVGKLQVLHCGEKRRGLDLDSLRKQLPRTRSQDIRQWIVDLVGLTQGDNLASLVHGVSLSSRGSGRLDTRLDTPPISFRHHPVSHIAPTPSTPPYAFRPAGRREPFALNHFVGRLTAIVGVAGFADASAPH